MTFAPCRCATCLARWRSPRMTARLRSAPTTWSRLVRGVGCAENMPRVADTTSCTCRAVVLGRPRAENAPPTPAAWRRRLSASSERAGGTGAGVHGRTGPAGVPGVASRNSPRVATPAMPSAMAWCMRANRPICRSGSPVRNHISHSGRDRSRRRRRNCSVTPSSAVSSPGAGRLVTRTWSARSNAGASVHSGPPSPRRGTWRTCRNRGTRCNRASTACRAASIRNRPSRSIRLAPSRTASAPMSCGQRSSGHSMSRSSAVSRSIDRASWLPASARGGRSFRGEGPLDAGPMTPAPDGHPVEASIVAGQVAARQREARSWPTGLSANKTARLGPG